MFAASNITVTKAGQRIIDDVTLSTPPSAAIALLGENGSGKSTLLRSIALTEPDAHGTVAWGDVVWDANQSPYIPSPWPDITIVFQSLTLWPHLTARENVLLPWRARGADAVPHGALARLFDLFHLDALLDSYPLEMSGGQRQRLALVRALAVAPKVLLLDEPSSALDANYSKLLIAVLTELKHAGTTVIFSTHSLGFAERLADRYAFLDQGRVIEAGNWSSIYDSRHPIVTAYLDINRFGTKA
jgi:ABC-type sulfate/molybdate transport systems ATPase subunit